MRRVLVVVLLLAGLGLIASTGHVEAGIEKCEVFIPASEFFEAVKSGCAQYDTVTLLGYQADFEHQHATVLGRLAFFALLPVVLGLCRWMTAGLRLPRLGR